MRLSDAIPYFCDHHLNTYRHALETIQRVRNTLTQLPDVELDQLPRLAVVEWHHRLGQRHPIAANTALAHLRLLYRKMIEWGLYEGANPAQYVKPFPRAKRRVTVPAHKLPALMSVLSTRPDLQRLYFLTVMLCGCRRDELRLAQWAHMDLEAGTWDIPQPKNDDPHRLTLPAELLGHYRQAALSASGPWIFTHRGATPWSATSVERYWRQIRRLCGLDHVHLHDLRRTLISYFCNQGESRLAQMIANHRTIRTTEGYWVRGESPQVTTALERYARRVMGTGATGGAA